jgi:hypothetical protein
MVQVLKECRSFDYSSNKRKKKKLKSVVPWDQLDWKILRSTPQL